MWKSFSFIALLLSLFFSHEAVAQSPGGVSSNLELWFKSDAGVNSGGSPASDGDSVDEWEDQSGNGNDVSGTGATRPLFRNSSTLQLNFNPTIDFDGADDFLEAAQGGYSHEYYIVTYQDDAITAATTGQTIYGAECPSCGLSFSGLTLGAFTAAFADEVVTHGVGGSSEWRSTLRGAATIPVAPYIYVARENAGGNGTDLYINSLEIDNDTNSTYLSVSDELFRIGKSVNTFGLFYDGRVAEVIAYSARNNDNNKSQIESYLALKYGLTLDQTTSTDYTLSDGTVVWDASGNGSYNNDIAGVGQDTGSGLSQSQSRSSNSDALVTMNDSTLVDARFLIWANDNGNATTWTTTDAPGDYERFAREWRVDELNGDTGDVTVSIDRSDLPDVNNHPVLLVDSDGTFASGATIVEMTYSNGTWSADHNFADDDYFTFAYLPASPGGYETNLILWYRADQFVESGGSDAGDGDSVDTWHDMSGDDNDGGSSGGNRPTYRNSSSNQINFNPYLDLDGSSDFMAIANLNYSAVDFSQIYTCVVFRTSYNSGSFTSNWAFLDFDRSEHFNVYIYGTGEMGFSYRSGSIRDNGTSSTFNDGTPHIACYNYDNTVTNDTEIRVDGNSELSSNVLSGGALIGRTTTRYGFVGDGSEANAYNGSRNNIYHDGDIAEVIYYRNTSVSSASQNRIESYLALKYGITLNQTSGQDYVSSDGTVIWDASALGSYNNDVAGIGQDYLSSLNQTQSQSLNSDAIVTMAEAGDTMTDGEFLIWSNDNGSTAAWTTTEVASTLNRIEREWVVEENNGDVGDVTISVDNSDLPTGATTDIKLLVDADGDFTSDVIVVDMTNVSGTWQVNYNLSDGQYFTFGYGELRSRTMIVH